jgi:hypothetical protein
MQATCRSSGSGFRSGQQAYRLAADGLRLFPRLAGAAEEERYALGATRLSSGIPALDAMRADGYYPGASTLVVMLSYLQEQDVIGRTISVIKTRGSRHDPAVRRFVISSDGIMLEDTGGPDPAGTAVR